MASASTRTSVAGRQPGARRRPAARRARRDARRPPRARCPAPATIVRPAPRPAPARAGRPCRRARAARRAGSRRRSASSSRPRTRSVDSMMPLPVTTIVPTMSTVHFCRSDDGEHRRLGGQLAQARGLVLERRGHVAEPRDRQPADADRLEILLRRAQRGQHLVGDAAAVAVGLGQGGPDLLLELGRDTLQHHRKHAQRRQVAAGGARGRDQLAHAVLHARRRRAPAARSARAAPPSRHGCGRCAGWSRTPGRRCRARGRPRSSSGARASPTTTARFARTRPSSTEPVDLDRARARDLAAATRARRPSWTSGDAHRDARRRRARVAVERRDDAAVRLDDRAVADAQLGRRGSPTPISWPVTVMPSTPGAAGARRAPSAAPARDEALARRARRRRAAGGASSGRTGATPRATGSLEPPRTRRASASSLDAVTTPASAARRTGRRRSARGRGCARRPGGAA